MTDPVLAVLDDLRVHLAPPDADADPVADAMATIRTTLSGTRRRRPRRARRVAVVLATIGAVATLSPARAAVADLLGLGGVRIELAESLPPELAAELDLGLPVSIEDARDLAPVPLPLPDELSHPAGAFAGAPTGAVTIVWAPDARLPEIADSGVGLLITVWSASLDDDRALKGIGPGTTVEPVDIDGTPGLFISGAPHAFQYTDADGAARLDHSRLAANTLLWSRAGVTYRLESALDRDRTLSLAASLPD